MLSDDHHVQIISALPHQPYVPIVTPPNLQRLAFINAVTKSVALPQGHYPVRLVGKITGPRLKKSPDDPSPLTPSIISRLMTKPDSDLGRHCIVGMLVMVTHNISKHDDIVNGTVGKLHQ